MHRYHNDHHGRRFARGLSGPREGVHIDDYEGRGRHRGREGRGAPGSGRVFDHGALRLVVLHLISERPRHGYEIIKAIEDRLAGTYSPSPGVIYPTLTLLDELGHATVTEADGKKLYAVTAEGAAYLAANQTALDAALARIAAVNAAHDGGPAPEIIRARENLRLALRLRLARGPLTAEQIRGVAAALDAAAVAVESS
jgi:DNA-binding PadR family transcriptional regulator